MSKPLVIDARRAVRKRAGWVHPVLRRDGTPHRDGYQGCNWQWVCPSCETKTTAARCDGTRAGKPHEAVAAPLNYRVGDRLVKMP